MEIVARIYKSKPIYNHRTAWFLLIVGFLFVLLRLPSLIEPHWYGDEGIYQVVGRAIASGRILYKDIWDNKPPVLYVLYALVYGNLFWIKLLSLISGLLSVLAFYALAAKILPKKSFAPYFSTALYAVIFGLPLLEGNIANAENFMLLPIVLAAYFVVVFSETKKIFALLFAGFLLSIAFTTKVVAIFDFAAFFVFLTFSTFTNVIRNIIRTGSYFFVSFIFLMAVFILYFLSYGALKDFISSVFLQNVSYVGEQNHFIFPLGVLFIKTIILFLGIVFLIAKRKSLSKQTFFLYVWTAFSIYNTFFSERPYTHYVLVALPAFSLLAGHFIAQKKTRLIDGFLLISMIILAVNYFQPYKKTVGYYVNYMKFVAGKESSVDYESFFDKSTPRDYDLANFIAINLKSNETVFLWSDNAQIYALSNRLPIGKYIVAYHITFYKNADIITKQQIEKMKPKYIIQTVDDPLVKDIVSSYQLKYIMEGAKIYER